MPQADTAPKADPDAKAETGTAERRASPQAPPQATPQPTPMIAQFTEIKRSYPDCLLFYRMGDFYELFFDDAVAAAAALDITLTKRGRHAGEDIPMCGVPVHAADSYLSRLI
ncbi:MAG: DNA mismatch repair protein MutS, partial [Rhodospirillaceae bacterium]|nr:DNA mismatch repair protein MutS [Rhodospirillaceae bacterium]